MTNAFNDFTSGGASRAGLGDTSTTTTATEPLVTPLNMNPGVNLNNQSTQGAPSGASATSNLASGIGGILLFPGKTIVSQFVGSGDPLDTSHLPITVLVSAAAWYALYYYFFGRNAPRSSH